MLHTCLLVQSAPMQNYLYFCYGFISFQLMQTLQVYLLLSIKHPFVIYTISVLITITNSQPNNNPTVKFLCFTLWDGLFIIHKHRERSDEGPAWDFQCSRLLINIGIFIVTHENKCNCKTHLNPTKAITSRNEIPVQLQILIKPLDMKRIRLAISKLRSKFGTVSQHLPMVWSIIAQTKFSPDQLQNLHHVVFIFLLRLAQGWFVPLIFGEFLYDSHLSFFQEA